MIKYETLQNNPWGMVVEKYMCHSKVELEDHVEHLFRLFDPRGYSSKVTPTRLNVDTEMYEITFSRYSYCD